jgi:hypothetical protein
MEDVCRLADLGTELLNATYAYIPTYIHILGPNWAQALHCGLGLFAGLGAYLVKLGSGFY